MPEMERRLATIEKKQEAMTSTLGETQVAVGKVLAILEGQEALRESQRELSDERHTTQHQQITALFRAVQQVTDRERETLKKSAGAGVISGATAAALLEVLNRSLGG